MVLQKHEGLSGNLTRQSFGVRRGLPLDEGLSLGRCTCEQPHMRLHPKHARHSVINQWNPSGAYLLREMRIIDAAGHVHVDACEQRFSGGLPRISDDPMGEKLSYRAKV